MLVECCIYKHITSLKYFLTSLIFCTLEFLELTAPSVETLVVSVSFISNTGKLADADILACVGKVRSLFAVLDDGFCEVREALLLELWSTGCV